VFWDVRLCLGLAFAGVSKDYNIFLLRVKQSKNGQLDPVDEGITLFRKGSNCLPVDMTFIFEDTNLHEEDSFQASCTLHECLTRLLTDRVSRAEPQ
jgi:hypothetical protein